MAGVKINLTEEAMNDINRKLQEASNSASNIMNELINDIVEYTKPLGSKGLLDKIANFTSFYNITLLGIIELSVHEWRDSESSVSAAIKRTDPDNEEAIETAKRFEDRLYETAKESVVKKDVPAYSTAHPNFEPENFNECVNKFKSAHDKLDSLYTQKREEFNSGAEENAIYACCAPVVVLMLKEFIGAFEGGMQDFASYEQKVGSVINTTSQVGNTATQNAANSKAKGIDSVMEIMRSKGL